MLLHLNEITKLSVTVCHLSLSIGNHEQLPLGHLDIDLITSCPKRIIILQFILIKKIQNRYLERFIQIPQLIAKVLILLNVNLILVLDLYYFLTDVYNHR